MINSVLIQVNSICNLNCKHCFYEKSDSNIPDLTYKKAIKIINKLTKEGLKNVSFAFKEPLLNPEIFDIIKYCEKKGIRSNILTNGVLLNKNIDNILGTNITSLGISLDGIDSNTNDYVRGIGNFEKVIEAIRAFVEKRGLVGKYIPVVVYLTISTIDKGMQKHIPSIFTELGIDKLVINTIDTSIGAAKNNKHLFHDEARSFEVIAESYSELNNANLLLEFATTPLENLYYNFKYGLNLPHTIPNCGIVGGTYHINSKGDFSLCFLDDIKENRETKFNVFTNLDEFYEARLNFISNYNVSKNRYQKCENCYYSNQCNPCFLKNNDFKKFIVKCKHYINEIESFINTIRNNKHDYYIYAKETSYIEIQGDEFQLVNLIQEGKPDITSLSNDSTKTKELIKKIYSNQYIKVADIFTEDSKFLNLLISTNCFYIRRNVYGL